jgi:hypothetical protein
MTKRLLTVSFALLAIVAPLLIVSGHRIGIVHADVGCGPAMINNSYGFALSGLFDPSFNGTPEAIGSFVPIAGAGTFSFDGKSTVTRSFTLSFGGAIFPVTDSGTYSLSSDCTGSAVFPGSGETWNLVLTGGGKEIKTMITTSGRVLAGTLTRQ